MDELRNAWREKKMYGQFSREITDDVDETKSWNWVRQSDLKPGTVSLIFSAQEQALRTNYSKHLNHRFVDCVGPKVKAFLTSLANVVSFPNYYHYYYYKNTTVADIRFD